MPDIYLKRYEALRLLGQGGMGRVFLGRQLDNGREVVIKVMHDHIARNPRFRQDFAREMKLMTRFRHHNAVALYDASLDDPQQPCIVMEYVPGMTLDALIQKERRLNAFRMGLLLGQLCQVMQAAHNAGIIHRDLTPVNVMLMNPGTTGETVKVMDFGLARMGVGPYIALEKLTGDDTDSIGGGTPDFVSPEQVRGEEVDHRADLYSIGVLLFKLLTGWLPFEKATTPAEILQCHVHSPVPRFADVGAGGVVPAAIEALVYECLAKYPRERPQSAIDLAQRYEKALGRKILMGDALPTPVEPPSSGEHVDPRLIVERVEAWMPEPIAIVKLRGFVHDVGGEIFESEPGLIKVRLVDKTAVPVTKSGFFTLLGLGPKPVYQHAIMELHMQKKTVGQKNLVVISVVMRAEEDPRRNNAPDFCRWTDQLCRDLKAYMIGR